MKSLRDRVDRLEGANRPRHVSPAEGEAARREIAARIDKAYAAAQAGDMVATYQLARIYDRLAATVRERPVPDAGLVEELQAIADSYRAAAVAGGLDDLDVRDSWGEGRP